MHPWPISKGIPMLVRFYLPAACSPKPKPIDIGYKPNKTIVISPSMIFTSF